MRGPHSVCPSARIGEPPSRKSFVKFGTFVKISPDLSKLVKTGKK